MQNTTNQPQDFYTKPIAPVSPIMKQEATPNSASKKPKKSLRGLFAIVGLVLFALIAIMGVLIAQKQVAQRGENVTPVAPNAPASRPAASTDEPNSCVTYFYVAEPEVVCDSKIALTNFTEAEGKPIPAGTKFNVGDEMVFSIAIAQPTDGYAENIKVVDILPESLVFVSGPSDPSYTLTVDGQTVTADISKMGASSVVKVEFKVRVVSKGYGENTNIATIPSNKTTSTENNCSYKFTTLEGKVECVAKTMEDLSGKLVATGSALERGKEYTYYINVKATNQPYGEVKIHDQIPAPLEYVRPAKGSEKYFKTEPTNGLIFVNLGQLKANTELKLGVVVKVPENPKLGEFTNTALVYAFPPGSKQKEPISGQGSCSISHTILPIGTAECISKEAYDDFDGKIIASGSEIDPTKSFIYKITVQAEKTTTGPVKVSDILHKNLLFIKDDKNSDNISYNEKTREVSADLGVMTSGQEKVIQFKVQLLAQPAETTFKNVAKVTTNNTTEHTCELPLKVTPPVYKCNSECEAQADCSDLGEDYICHPTGNGSSACRLANNPDDVDCEPAKTAPPTTPPPTGPATPTPTPAPGCNELCTANADCSNSTHICVTVEDGATRCRLAEYTSSRTCTEPVTATPVAQQPVLPEALPQSGPEDWINWLKAGLVTLGVGTALFLLL